MRKTVSRVTPIRSGDTVTVIIEWAFGQAGWNRELFVPVDTLRCVNRGVVVFQQIELRLTRNNKFCLAQRKNRATDVADLEQTLRIIQSIPSKKAEPIKRWFSEVGAQRIDQMIDPELTFQMAVEDYRRQGYSDKWIENRLKSIRTRKALTDEWERSGVKEQKDFAVLTNILTKAWSGMTTGEYKRYKSLTKENLRDNMTNLELALNTLAEAATTEISRNRNPKTMKENKQVAQSGGKAAKVAREEVEKQIGHSVISRERASDYLLPTEDAEVKKIE